MRGAVFAVAGALLGLFSVLVIAWAVAVANDPQARSATSAGLGAVLTLALLVAGEAVLWWGHRQPNRWPMPVVAATLAVAFAGVLCVGLLLVMFPNMD